MFTGDIPTENTRTEISTFGLVLTENAKMEETRFQVQILSIRDCYLMGSKQTKFHHRSPGLTSLDVRLASLRVNPLHGFPTGQKSS